jgi:hypothetical protein
MLALHKQHSSRARDYTGCLKKELYNGIPNVPVRRVLQKHLHLKQFNTLNDGQFCMPLSVNVFITLATFGIPL